MKYAIVIMMALQLAACGKKGDAGLPGTNGSNGSNGQNGQQGLTGSTGATGAQGATGPSGADGTQITPVQLCPSSYVPTYPSVFPETALCINGSLFAVYSANDGFLTLLTPGGYSSNGINSSCSFTVVSGCTITN